MSRHVVFGAGQIGTHVASQLLDAGNDVVVVSRNGRTVPTGARRSTAISPMPSSPPTAAEGAAVIYFCLNAPNYHSWPEAVPSLCNGPRCTRQPRPVHGSWCSRTCTPTARPADEPSPRTCPPRRHRPRRVTRIEMTNELLEAHRRGDLNVTIGRASDFFGPGVTKSALGEQVDAPGAHR